MMSVIYDIAIIGAGIAGASLAAECAGAARTIVLEAEDQPGYHATGRSAAFWEECYGGPEIVPLTLASGSFLRRGGFLSARGALYIGRDQDADVVDAFMQRFGNTGATIERLSRTALHNKLSGLQSEWSKAIWEASCADIDVAALHRHYLDGARAAGAEIRCRAAMRSATRSEGVWTITLGDGAHIRARIIANAAGAWADAVAGMAGAKPLGITPYRRTVAQLRCSAQVPPDLPLVLDINGGFYFKPENGRVWLSPHDETPSPACDVAPEEMDVALAIDRFQRVVDWGVDAVEYKWAGLRSFAADRRPIYGFDPTQEGFFWCAGQGGFGIQTAPAGARLAAQLLLHRSADEITQGLDAALYAPERFLQPHTNTP